MTSRALAAGIGIVTGAFLFLFFTGSGGSNVGFSRWYQSAAFLAGFGLAGVFPAARLAATAGVATAPCLVTLVQTGVEMLQDAGCCNLWPIGLVVMLVLGAPAPLVGGFVSRLLDRAHLLRPLSVVALASSLAIGALSPSIARAERRRLESVEIPGLLKRIYASELEYRARRPDGAFTCDGTELPGVGKLGWSHVGRATIPNLLIVQYYTIRLTCHPTNGTQTFRADAFSHDVHVPAARFSIDQSGTLTASATNR